MEWKQHRAWRLTPAAAPRADGKRERRRQRQWPRPRGTNSRSRPMPGKPRAWPDQTRETGRAPGRDGGSPIRVGSLRSWSQAELQVQALVRAGARLAFRRPAAPTAAAAVRGSVPALHARVLHLLHRQLRQSAHVPPRSRRRLRHRQRAMVGFRQVPLHQDFASTRCMRLLQRLARAWGRELRE